MNKRPTLADVAHAAQVSKTTASMALNGKGVGKIPITTRERVLAAAGELQFRPHGVARALVRRRADVLGVICTINPFVEMSHHAFEQGLLSAVFFHALERGYNPMIYGASEQEVAEEFFPRYADGRSDAFIALYPPSDSKLLAYLQRQGIPVAALCCSDPIACSRWVDSDNEGGIQAAISHLVALGHRHIAYLVGPEIVDQIHTRIATYWAMLEKFGLPRRADRVASYTWDIAAIEQQMDRWFREDDAPTALLAWNDMVAEEAYKAIRRRGLRIPEDVSIVGFDDMPSSRVAVPPLTTVRQDVIKMGRAAVDLALDAFTEDSSAERPTFLVSPVELVVRQSTAPPKH